MTESSSDRNPVELLAEEFLKRYRQGQRPPLSEYTEQYPEHADAIRELFPVLLEVELARPEADQFPALGGTRDDIEGIGERGHVGDYAIIREIGRGGMGVVYEAEQQSLSRRVALKLLPRHASNDKLALERFRREARAAAKLHHTNIVPVFDVGEEGDLCYYAMQYIQGQPLDFVIDELRRKSSRAHAEFDRTTRGSAASPFTNVVHSLLTGQFAQENFSQTTPSPHRQQRREADTPSQSSEHTTQEPERTEPGPENERVAPVRSAIPGALSKTDPSHRLFFQNVAQLGHQVAEALAYAHARGVVHRDIKPSNLLLDSAGVIWVTDFGMAKVDDEALTHTGDILGTLRYMAPERFKGECDDRADLYALGLTLYELLVLSPAFNSADRLQLIEMISNQTPLAPRAVDPHIPRDLETIVLKAIEKDPQARYQTAQELSGDLERFLEDRPIRARRIGVAERLVRWSRRNPGVAGLSVAIACLLVMVAILTSVAAYRFERSARNERHLKDLAKAAESRANENAEQLRRRDYVSRVNLAYHESQNDNMARALELLEGCPAELRGWEWDYVHARCQVALRTHHEPAPSVNSLAFSPDGKQVALGTGSFLSRRGNPGDLVVRDTWTGEVRFAHRDLADGVMAVAFSPDGSQIASGNGSDLTVWDAKTGEPLFSHPGESFDLLGLAFSPDGRRLAAGYGEFNGNGTGYAKVWDAKTGEAILGRLPGREGGVWSLAFHPRKNQLALTSEGLVEVWDLNTREPVLKVTGHPGFLYAIAYHPDGRYLATGGLDRTIRLWNADSGQLVRTYTGHTGFVRGLAFSPDGTRIISASEDKSLRLWDLDSERALGCFRGHAHFVNCVAFNRDGKIFASGSLDQTAKLWFATPDQQLIYRGHVDEGHVLGLAFDPGGEAVASSSFFFSGTKERLHLWDQETGERLLKFPKNVGEVADVAFHPGGTRLAAAHRNGTISLWDTTTGRLLTRLAAHVGEVWCVAFSPDGSRFASSGRDGGVNVWSTDSARMLFSVFGHREFVRDLEFNPDGSRLATASDDGTVKLWDAQTGRELLVYDKHRGKVSSVAFSPDGNWIASTGGIDHRLGEVRIWDAVSGRDLRGLVGHTDIVLDAAFSPEGRRLATASDDRTIKLWDTQSGQEVFTLRGHTGGVVSVKFSPDGRRITSGGVDRTVRVWEMGPPEAQVLYRREAVAHADRAGVLVEDGQWQQAIAAFDRALDLGLDRPQIHVGRGIAYAQLGNSAISDAEFSKAIRASEPDAQRLVVLGTSLAGLGHVEHAADALQRATTLAPDDPLVLCAVGRLYAQRGQAELAREAFTHAVATFQEQTGKKQDPSPRLETGWWISGAFPGELETPYAPETALLSGSPAGKSSPLNVEVIAKTNWRTAHEEGDGYVDLGALLNHAEQATAYALQNVFSPDEQHVTLLLGSDDAMRLWVNGALTFEQTSPRLARPGQNAVPVTFEPGWNALVTKVVNYTGQHGMYVEISDHPRDRARAHTDRRELDRVLEVWAVASETERDDPQLLNLAGNAFARRGRWKDAAVVFRRLVERQPARNRNWVTLAPLLVQTGDLEGYRRHCRRLLALFGDTRNPVLAERTSKACLLLPDLLQESALPAELAEIAVSEGANHRFLSFFEFAHAVALYRSEDFTSALEVLGRSLTRGAIRDPYLDMARHLLLAMAHHKLGDSEQSRKHFEKADELFQKRLPKLDRGDLGAGWSDWLVCQILRREAEELLSTP